MIYVNVKLWSLWNEAMWQIGLILLEFLISTPEWSNWWLHARAALNLGEEQPLVQSS